MRDHAAPREHVGPPGPLGGHDEIGEERQHPAGAGDRAGDRRHHRCLGLPQLLEQALVVDGEVAVVERSEILRRIRTGSDVPPVQKSRSLPARTMARTVWSASTRCRNVRSAMHVSKSMALRQTGRSSVSTATAPASRSARPRLSQNLTLASTADEPRPPAAPRRRVLPRATGGDLAGHDDRLRRARPPSGGAGRWLRSVGAGRDTRVALFMDDRLEYLVAMFATWRSGATLVPCNSRLTADELAFLVSDAGATSCSPTTGTCRPPKRPPARPPTGRGGCRRRRGS